jgi:hypothetical protein
MAHSFLDRIPQDNTWHNAAATAFSAVAAFRTKVDQIKSDKRYSAQGHLEEIRAAAKAGPLAYFESLRQDVAAERAKLAGRREHFELPVLDRDDVVGALNHQEIRSYLRSLPIGERIKEAASDPVIAAAAQAAPGALSGLDADAMARSKAFLVDHLFGAELAVLDAEEAVITNVAQAVDIAEGELLNSFEPERVPFKITTAA